jgi:hypothetical protein
MKKNEFCTSLTYERADSAVSHHRFFTEEKKITYVHVTVYRDYLFNVAQTSLGGGCNTVMIFTQFTDFRRILLFGVDTFI